MAGSIANLAVSITARTKKFRKGMQRASKSLRRFTKRVRASAMRVAKFGAVLGTAAAAGMALLVRQSFKTIDALAKTSDKLGIATDKLIGLRLAARLAGVDERTLEMGLQRMTRRVSEAAIGTGEAQAAIKELGLEAAKLDKLPLEKKFAAFGDALDKVDSAATRVRLGFKIFDSEGVALINVVRGGSKALEAAQKNAERLGITLTRFDAAKVELANNAITEMKDSIVGIGRQLAINMAPLVTLVADRMTEWRLESINAGKGIAFAFATGIEGAGRMFDWLGRIRAEFILMRVAAQQVLLDVVKWPGKMGDRMRDISKQPGLARGKAGGQQLTAEQYAVFLQTGILPPKTKANMLDMTPRKGGMALVLEEEIRKGTSAAAALIESFVNRDNERGFGKWFEDVIAAANELAKKMLATNRAGQLAVAGIGGMRGPQRGLRGFKELGGFAGAKVSRAEERFQQQEMKALLAIQAATQATAMAVQQGGMRP